MVWYGMVSPAQALAAELGQVSAERDRDQGRLSDAKRQQVRLEVSVRELSAERDALVSSYRALVLESRRGKQDLQAIRSGQLTETETETVTEGGGRPITHSECMYVCMCVL